MKTVEKIKCSHMGTIGCNWKKGLLCNKYISQCACGKPLSENEITLYRSKCKDCCPNNHQDNPGGYCACGGRDFS